MVCWQHAKNSCVCTEWLSDELQFHTACLAARLTAVHHREEKSSHKVHALAFPELSQTKRNIFPLAQYWPYHVDLILTMGYCIMRYLYLLPVMFWDQFAQLVFFHCFCVSKTVFTVLVKAFRQCDYPGAQIFVLSFQHLYFLFIWKKNPLSESLILLAVA